MLLLANVDNDMNVQYADVKLWSSTNGYVDYLCPQIYFGLAHQTHPFEQVALAFSQMVADTDVRLVPCMTLEKAARGFAGQGDTYAGTGENEWIERQDVLLRCLQQAERIEGVCGVAYFSYRLFYSPSDGSEYLPTQKEREALLPYLLDAYR